MKIAARIALSLLLVSLLLSSAIPCGPGYVTPLFDVDKIPEAPYTGYAAGRLGIVKPGFKRAALIAAYRYINGSGLNDSEQKAIVEVWRAAFDNREFADTSIDDALKTWIAKRKEVMANEKRSPEIYADRTDGGYDFFPNCAKNAFEVAADTLSDRVSAHGPTDASVVDWVNAQDLVFQNCTSGRRTPPDAPAGAPEWLQKDRAYQKAAADFYALDYEAAKREFAEIAADNASPWQETADYLVARTLIRQASLAKDPARSAAIYIEAEQQLERFISRTGKFNRSAEQLMGLVRYRTHPKERVLELSRTINGYGDNQDFRQNVIDYTWLLDKFESEAMRAEQKRQLREIKPGATADDIVRANVATALANIEADITANVDDGNVSLYGEVRKAQLAGIMQAVSSAAGVKSVKNELEVTDADDAVAGGKVKVYIYRDEGEPVTVYADPAASDDDVLSLVQKAVGKPLNDDLKKRALNAWHDAYGRRFTDNRSKDYEGGYAGDDKLTPAQFPDFLRRDEMTEWLFVYAMKPETSYNLALERYRSGGSDLWLMTALSKAVKTSPDAAKLVDAAIRANRQSAAFTTISYYAARLLNDMGRSADAAKLIDENLAMGDQIPVSARNAFQQLKLHVAASLDEYIKASLRSAYAFDYDGTIGTMDEFIAEQKSWYDPESSKQTKEEYDAEIEKNMADEKLWQGRQMFDTDVIAVFNDHFTTAKLYEVEQSPSLPDYMRSRFAIAIWMRSYLANDAAMLAKISPELAKYRPDLAESLAEIAAAKSPASRDTAMLFFVLKNPMLSPYIEDGIGRTDNEQGDWDANDWWCAPYEPEDGAVTDDDSVPSLPRPPFITPAMDAAAKAENAKLRVIGDAPKWLADKVMAWAKRSPADKRVPEALYIVTHANGWTKYGCGSNNELHEEIKNYLYKTYPQSEWATKLRADEEGN